MRIRRLQMAATASGDETFDTLLARPNVRIEHIVSRGSPSPPDFWYDSTRDEWVALLTGSATLRFDNERVELTAGMHLFIPARTRHRVDRCSVDATWLAVHLGR